jgi:hypothetical protein
MYIHMANEHVKIHSPPFVIKEMQIKTTMKYHFTSTMMAVIKTMENNKARMWRRWTLLCIAGGNANWCRLFGKVWR